ncbi:MAG: spore cortex biosynthesis protein YabQ [Oscillospiraceae bacterium]|nr:spore cortex biosynthesis protein YabQ [Oscillospiraceae bacterium]
MIGSVENEAYIFIAMFIVGGAAGFMFDIFKMLRMLDFGRIWIFMTDLVFWTLATGMFLCSVMYFNDGRMRWYEFVGISLGLFLYFLLLSRYITAVFVWIAKIIYKISTTIFKIVLTPVQFLYKILSVPILFVLRGLKKACSVCGNKRSAPDAQNAGELIRSGPEK